MADIVEDILTRLVQQVPGVTTEATARIERDVRHQWGGCEVYVGKRMSICTCLSMVGNGLRQQKPLGQSFKEAGVSTRTGYRMLAKK